MSISRLPIRIGHLRPERPTRKHRAIDEVQRLQTLLGGAHALIKGLQLQLEDKDREHEAAVARIDERHHAIVTQMQNELADVERRLEIRTWAEAAAATTQPIPVITRVMPLHQSPMADPTHVPTWAVACEPDPAA